MEHEGAVIDLDGTVYRGDRLIDGARDTVRTLRDHGLGIVFVTNNPTRSPAGYVDRLADLDIEADEREVLSAGTVTAEFLADRHPDDDVFVIGSDGLREQLQTAAVDTTTDPDAADVVVTSHDYDFDYDALTDGLWALEQAEAFYGTDPDRTYPGGDGRPYPGSGAITSAVAGVAEREPDRVLGKPSGVVVELIGERLATLENSLVVGDSLDTDIALGERAGMTSVLVTTGRSDRADAESADVTPDYVVDGLADVLDLF